MIQINTLNIQTHTRKVLSRGFSLVELMIVVAIIGIIAALAVPAYQDHMARAQMTEVWNMVEVVRMRLWEYYSEHGTFPGDAPTGRVVGNPTGNLAYELPLPSNISGRYVESVTINSTGALVIMNGAGTFPIDDPADGILVKIRQDAARPIAGKVFGFRMHIEGNATLRWVCTERVWGSSGASQEKPANYGQIPLRLMPGSCRTR